MALNEGINLTDSSSNFGEILFRDELIKRCLEAIAKRRSIILFGPDGVGKTAIVHGLVAAMRKSGRASVYEFSVGQILTGTRYLGDWESKLASLISGVQDAGAVLYFSDIWNITNAGKSSNREASAWDIIRPLLESQQLILIGETGRRKYNELKKSRGFGKNFEGIEVPPLGPDEIREILVADARRRNIAIEASSTNRLISVCQQFLSSTNGPGPALQLQRDVFDYAEQKRGVNEPEPITPEFVEKVFSIYSGMPPFVVSPSISKPAAEISAWFHERIFGQSEAIRAIVESIALYKAGLHDPKKPIGSFLFVGPTGVGKTETARALAQFLFGSEDRMLRFDMSEFKDYHAFETLIGDPEKPLQPARLVDPVRSNPFQLVLLDEIEKAHRNVWDLLLQVLDEGRLTSGLGDSVSYCNTIIIATSNVGAAVQQRQRMGFVHDAGDSVRDRLRTELETEFRPELLNRFQHIVAFRALRKDEVMQIARAEIARVLRRQGLVDREINVDVADAVVSLVVNDGYDEKYGARSLKRMVQRHIALPIATLLLERRVNDTSIIRLDEKGGQVRGRLIQAPAASPVSKAPAKTAESLHRRDKTTDSLRQWLEQLKGQREELVDAMQAADRRTRAGGADAVSELPSDWKSSEELARYYRRVELELDRSRRIDRLAAIEAELRSWIDRAGTPAERKAVASELAQYADEIRSATLELTQMEPMDASDAIVALLPLRADNSSAIEMFGVYQRWARHRGCELKMLCEPLTPDEPIVFGIIGQFAFGYLRNEAGLHRHRDGTGSDVVSFEVAPWVEASTTVSTTRQRALKKRGLLGGRVRSRIELAESAFPIQNDLAIAENRALANDVVATFLEGRVSNDVIVRRFERKPFLLKDYLTDTRSGRADSVNAENFHDLLSRRVEITAKLRSHDH